MDILALPFCHIRRIAQRPPDPAYPKSLTTIGEHIRKRRIDLGLFQKQVARLIGVAQATIYNWEAGTFEPETRFLPKIYEFLGYCPMRFPKTFGEKLKLWRDVLGLSQEEFAKKTGVDESSITEWETGKHKPTERSLGKVNAFLNSYVDENEVRLGDPA